MKPIKVYLQYPWKFPDSPYYNSLLQNPPKNVSFVNIKNKNKLITSSFLFKFSQKLKNFIKDTPEKIGLILLNLRKVSEKDIDLVHAAHCMVNTRGTPWVMDLEMIGSLLISGFKRKNWKRKVEKILLSKECKKIIPWTKVTSDKLLNLFPAIIKKLEIVYPAVPSREFNKKKKNKLTLLYVARAFHLKGGIIALEVMKRLKKKYNIDCILVSDVPPEVKKQYSEVNIKGLIPQKEVFKLMESSDIFLYPSQMDTFGFGILEAMSFGLPVIALETPNTESVSEIISPKEGFVIRYENPKGFIRNLSKGEEWLLEEIYKRCEILIKNASLRKKMSNNCIKLIAKGKFSIKERNKKLRKIYEDALK